MKKALALVMVTCLAFSLVACGGNTTSSSTPASSTASSSASSSSAGSSSTSTPASTGTATGGLKTGMAVVSNTSTTNADADGAGKAQVDSTVAAVLVDSEGKIVDCKLDVAQNKVAVEADGTFATDTTFKSKQEQGDEYGMKAASPIGKEWFEQADAFAAAVVGKTADEVSGLVAGEADLAATCTIAVDDFIAAVVAAANNAKELGAQAGDTLGLGVTSEMSHSSVLPADNEGEGLAQVDTTYAAVTYNAEGTISSSIIDSTQAKFTVSEEGAVAAKDAEIVSKQEQGDSYGMKAASPIGKEWLEQADAYAANLVGKTAADVAGLAGGEADLAATCTISVDSFNEAVTRAMA